MSSIREIAEEIATMKSSASCAEIANEIEDALLDERERCAKKAERARLPRGFQWGRDAMEQFNFGKERAAKAIRKED